MNVVWSCAGIIILSTWSILHLTVPPDVRAETKAENFWKEIYLLRRKLSWMFVMLMFPEYLLAIGAGNLIVAHQNNPVLEEQAETDKVPWSLTHTILADMGGIAIRFSTREFDASPNRNHEVDAESEETMDGSILERGDAVDSTKLIHIPSVPKDSRSASAIEHKVSDEATKFLEEFRKRQSSELRGLGDLPWKMHRRHIEFVSQYREQNPAKRSGHAWVRLFLKKFGLEDKLQRVTSINHLSPLHGNIWILDSKQLMIAREAGIIKRLPDIRPEDIADKSKSDGLVRLLALVQVSWLIIQLIVRLINRLPASALEISTLAFAVCAVIIYLIEWHKAKDISVPIYIDANPENPVLQETFDLIAEAAPTVFLRDRHYTMPQSCVHQVHKESRWSSEFVDRLIVWLSVFSTMLFGGLHMAAWNLEFPTNTELVLWRTAALSVAIVPSVCALMVLYEIERFGTTHTFSVLSVIIFAPLYLSSRWYLLIESFRSLYYLPPAALTETWATYAPHVS